jgi:hypothetical protein
MYIPKPPKKPSLSKTSLKVSMYVAKAEQVEQKASKRAKVFN